MKLNTIIPERLYVRGNALGLDRENKIRSLLDANISLVVNLWSRVDWDFTQRAESLPYHFQYVNYPIPDGVLPRVDKVALLQTASKIDVHLRLGNSALVQCHAGRNRAGLLAALVVRLYCDISGTAAMEMVRIRRPRAIDNLDFEQWLGSLS